MGRWFWLDPVLVLVSALFLSANSISASKFGILPSSPPPPYVENGELRECAVLEEYTDFYKRLRDYDSTALGGFEVEYVAVVACFLVQEPGSQRTAPKDPDAIRKAVKDYERIRAPLSHLTRPNYDITGGANDTGTKRQKVSSTAFIPIAGSLEDWKGRLKGSIIGNDPRLFNSILEQAFKASRTDCDALFLHGLKELYSSTVHENTFRSCLSLTNREHGFLFPALLNFFHNLHQCSYGADLYAPIKQCGDLELAKFNALCEFAYSFGLDEKMVGISNYGLSIYARGILSSLHSSISGTQCIRCTKAFSLWPQLSTVDRIAFVRELSHVDGEQCVLFLRKAREDPAFFWVNLLPSLSFSLEAVKSELAPFKHAIYDEWRNWAVRSGPSDRLLLHWSGENLVRTYQQLTCLFGHTELFSQAVSTSSVRLMVCAQLLENPDFDWDSTVTAWASRSISTKPETMGALLTDATTDETLWTAVKAHFATFEPSAALECLHYAVEKYCEDFKDPQVPVKRLFFLRLLAYRPTFIPRFVKIVLDCTQPNETSRVFLRSLYECFEFERLLGLNRNGQCHHLAALYNDQPGHCTVLLKGDAIRCSNPRLDLTQNTIDLIEAAVTGYFSIKT